MTITLILDSVMRSLQTGSLYALMALGLTLTMAVIRLPNFAHAELVTVGAYVALLASVWLTSSIPIILVLAFVVTALVALLTHRAVYRPLARLNPSTYSMILASFAVGLMVRYAIFFIVDHFDYFDKPVQVRQQIVFRSPNLILTNIFFWSVPTALVLMIALSIVLRGTDLGRQMRALADNAVLARVIGIPVDRVHDVTWLLVGGLAGVGGALWGIYTTVNPLMGWLTLLSVFAATVLGGMTSFIGTILGAYVVSFSENLLMQWLNFQFGLDFSFKPAVPFIIIILVLVFRPQGLTGVWESLRRWRGQTP